jgi:hypothetical protein
MYAADQYNPPPLDKAVPTALDLPADFTPPKGKPGVRLGFNRTSAVALDVQKGIHPICITEIPARLFAGGPLQNGDIMVAVNGKPLGKNPDAQFREAYGQAIKDDGVLWITRWRKGEIATVMLNLGAFPLDLTRSGTPGATRDWRLGPLGANGWCFHRTTSEGASRKARQILMTAVDKNGPAAGKLEVGDVILGAGGVKFEYDARQALAAAIDEAEKDENKGVLKLLVWRPTTKSGTGEGKEMEVLVTLPVMGSYSVTAPFDCRKTDKIVDHAVEHIKKNKDRLLKPGDWLSYINGLGLLATGRDDCIPLVKELAHGSLLKEGEKLSIQDHVGMVCWSWSYKTLFLCEYYLRTQDKAVLPTLEEYATKIAMGQSGAGTWGHTYAAINNTGYLHGNLGGYGAINQQGLTLMIVLPLAEKCGITNREIKNAIRRGNDFFSFFIEKGTIPYGDHGAANTWYDDNGKSGSAAIFFDLMKNRKGTKFFSEMIVASAPSGREAGHCGSYWSHLWGGIGVARGGDKALQVFMNVMNPIFTLERQPDGRFVYQGNAGENGPMGDPKDKWDTTGARLLQLCVPRRILYVTGKETPRETHLNPQRIDQLLSAGKLDCDSEARSKLGADQILQLLKDPLPPTRNIGARALAEQDLNIVPKLIQLLDSDDRYARYGAAEALCKAGYESKEAAEKLIRIMRDNKDTLFRSYAVDALINRDTKRGLLDVAKPAIPVLLQLAVEQAPDDPRNVLQQDISRALFYNGLAQPRVGLLHKYGLESADRSQLLLAMQAIMKNQNGGTRSMLYWTYAKLTPTEVNQLWPDIFQATRYVAPSGEMFAAGIRKAGLNAMADYHVKEGLPLAVWYLQYQEGHSAGDREPVLAVIEKYGAYAKEVIPDLEKCYSAWQAQKTRKADMAKLRETINKIKALPDDKKFELVSIADRIKDLPNPFLVAASAEDKAMSSPGK